MDTPAENRMEQSEDIAMRAVLTTVDKDGKVVMPGQSFYAGSKENAERLIAMRRAVYREKTIAKPTKRKNKRS